MSATPAAFHTYGQSRAVVQRKSYLPPSKNSFIALADGKTRSEIPPGESRRVLVESQAANHH